MKFRRWRPLTFCCAWLAVAAVNAQTAGPPADPALLGLWGAEPALGPQVRGPLLLDQRGQRWTVRVAGFEASAQQTADRVDIALPGQQGTLRVWVGAGTPEAFWVQPPAMGTPYATPVRLLPAGEQRWRGQVDPIDPGFPLYLGIAREPDGALRGVLRNPSLNWPGATPHYRLTLDGSTLVFSDPDTGQLRWRQLYDADRGTIAFDFGSPILLTRRSMAQAVGLTPRSPALPAYRYRQPADLGDGWAVSPAATQAMDQGQLQALVRALVAVDPFSATAPRVHSLLVARRGRLVLDEYFRGHGPDVRHDLRSASKTMTSIMVGAAMQQGAPIGADTALPGTAITLAHLLSHSSGLDCNDDDAQSAGREDAMQSQRRQNDWYAFFMALPKLHEPGSTYAYCSAGINMVGQLLGESTGLWLPRLFETHLAKPMRFSGYGINLMPSGQAYAGGGMHLRPRDFLKFGQLYLDGGRWQGQQIVDAAWVRTSVAHHIDRPDGSSDGLGWHRHTLTVGGRQFQSYEASGNGGQFLVVVPALELTVVVTAGNYGQYAVWRKIREEMVPAVLQAAR